MDGHELAARFSYITNNLRFCGPQVAANQFLEYIAKRNNKDAVEDSLRKFEGLYPYLSVIAQRLGKHFCDYDVVEAYWIGNKYLEQCNDEDLHTIINLLMQRGLPKSIGMGLIE